MGWEGHGGWAEVYGRVEEIRDRRDCWYHLEKRKEARLGKLLSYTGTCEAIPSLLVHDTKESCTGARRTKIFVAPGYYAQLAASIDAPLCPSVLFVSFVVRALVFYFYFISSVRRTWGEGGGLLPDFLFRFHTCVIVHPVK